MDDRGLSIVRRIAKKKGITGEINISTRKNKRFMVTLKDGKAIHFGLYPFKGFGTFIDHKNPIIRKNWRARHKEIMIGDKKAYLDKNSPEFYSWNLLW